MISTRTKKAMKKVQAMYARRGVAARVVEIHHSPRAMWLTPRVFTPSRKVPKP